VNGGFEKRLLVVWLILSAITMLSVWIGSLDGQGALRPNAVATSSAIVIALVKARVIFQEFMEVRTAPLCAVVQIGAYGLPVSRLKLRSYVPPLPSPLPRGERGLDAGGRGL